MDGGIAVKLRFVFGRAGTGKTRHCLDEVRARLAEAADGPPLIMLVPEQATFQTEYALLGKPDSPLKNDPGAGAQFPASFLPGHAGDRGNGADADRRER